MDERQKSRDVAIRQIEEAAKATNLSRHSDFEWYTNRRLNLARKIADEITEGKYLGDNAGYAMAVGQYKALIWDAKELHTIATLGIKGRQTIELLDSNS